jgi:KaiC/GvpD/RAD55 family RecA-like ATPase
MAYASPLDSEALASDLSGDSISEAYLATCYHLLTSSNQANLRLVELLDLVSRIWFLDPSQGDLYQAFIELAPVTGTNSTISDATIIAIAEKSSGERGWARPILNRLYRLPIENNLDVWRETLLPVWKSINNRTLALEITGEISKSLAFTCSPAKWKACEQSAAQLVEVLAGARTVTVEEHPIVAYHRQVLGPPVVNRRFSTGLSGLDAALGGGFASPQLGGGGRLIVVAGRPGQGKTAFAVSLATRAAMQGRQSLYFSLEMGPQQMSKRALAAMDYHLCMEWGGTPITSRQLDQHSMDAEQRERLANAPVEAFCSNLLFHRGGFIVSAAEAALQIRHAKQRNPDQFSICMIDYLGLLDMQGKKPIDAIPEATRQLKAAALTTGIDIVLMCQLSRGVEARTDKMPVMSDLRDSGAIEQDADLVIGLMRPHYYDPGADPKQLFYGIVKNRDGETERHEATFIGANAFVLDR